MELAREVVEGALNARQRAKRKLRWPIPLVMVSTDDDDAKRACKRLAEVIRAQTNTKSVDVIRTDEAWEGVEESIIPNPKKIGPIYKKDAQILINALKNDVNATELKQTLSRDGVAKLDVGGREFEVTPEMLSFSYSLKEGVYSSEVSFGTVYVDITLTEELEAEGYVKEIIRRAQQMRKELELEIDDEVELTLTIADDRVKKLVETLSEHIISEVRAVNIEITPHNLTKTNKSKTSNAPKKSMVKEWDVESTNITISLSLTDNSIAL